MNVGAFSTNNKLILQPYEQGQGLKSEIRNGIAFVSQKTTLVGLKLLVEARLADGSYLPAGSVVYLDESLLCSPSSKWAKDVKTCSALRDKNFIVADLSCVTLIDTAENIGV